MQHEGICIVCVFCKFLCELCLSKSIKDCNEDTEFSFNRGSFNKSPIEMNQSMVTNANEGQYNFGHTSLGYFTNSLESVPKRRRKLQKAQGLTDQDNNSWPLPNPVPTHPQKRKGMLKMSSFDKTAKVHTTKRKRIR